VPWGWDNRKDKVEGEYYEVRPVVIHLINLELAMERVCMPSKVACCLSNLCLATMTLSSQFFLYCVDLSRRSDKLSSK